MYQDIVLPRSTGFRVSRGGAGIDDVRWTPHGQMRAHERCAVPPSVVDDILASRRAVHVGESRGEARAYWLFYVPTASAFFVAVVAGDASKATRWVVTVLEQTMYEQDRGRLFGHELEEAASLQLSQLAFEAWRRAFDWTTPVYDRRKLCISVDVGHADGTALTVVLPGLPPDITPFLEGDCLTELGRCASLSRWLNMHLHERVGPAIGTGVDRIDAVRLMMGQTCVLDFLVEGDRSILDNVRARPVRRKDLTLVVTYAFDGKLHGLQKTAPAVPEDALWEDCLVRAGQDTAFLRHVRALVGKKVPPDQLDHALRGIAELQLVTASGVVVDLVTDDDRSVIGHLGALPCKS